MYNAEITAQEYAYIKACVLSTVRLAQEKMPESESYQVTIAAARAVSALNSAIMTTVHVQFINTCIQKTREHMRDDSHMSQDFKSECVLLGETIQKKLAGFGIERTVFVS